ncbi:imm11 family protein [Vitiosangium sp. GDMCC 1.1324]|uniref:imm11 family protein n=1 Tax=Vitiosangium sp. (strain GDMCC 1.1324) TaxID=2138576 RepID=UPI000D395971|nr:DUF1629 domain-containing protein [Vitiosangium sp. GDMCC 1.1324]PTL84214.1 hypothetical protein DAT35_12340 [Vitiosangium sp. GDMCC 1.1324]
MGFWMIGDRNDGAVLDAYPLNGPEGWRYLESHRLASEFPTGVAMKFSPSFPEQRKVYDFVTNTLNIRVVSKHVRRIVLELAPDDVEFLPVTLMDHQGGVASREHFIMNVLARRDVIDLERADVRMGAILKTEIDRVRNLVLKGDLEPGGPKVFRPLHLRVGTMIDETIHAAFSGAGLTGCKFFPANGWNGKRN